MTSDTLTNTRILCRNGGKNVICVMAGAIKSGGNFLRRLPWKKLFEKAAFGKASNQQLSKQ